MIPGLAEAVRRVDAVADRALSFAVNRHAGCLGLSRADDFQLGLLLDWTLPSGLQPMTWSSSRHLGERPECTVTGYPGADYTDEAGVQVAAAWAVALHLEPKQPLDHAPGTRMWCGLADGGRCWLVVWCVTDRDQFQGRLGEGEGE